MAGTASLEEIISSCLSPENLRRTQAEAALKVPLPDPSTSPAWTQLLELQRNCSMPTATQCLGDVVTYCKQYTVM